MRRGLTLDIYKHAGRDFSAGGISSRCDSVTVISVIDDEHGERPVPEDCQVFEPRPDSPAVALVTKRYSFGTQKFLTPLERGEGAGPAMGGCFAGSSDSRFYGLAGAKVLPLHDHFVKPLDAGRISPGDYFPVPGRGQQGSY